MQLSLDELIASVGRSISAAQGAIEEHSLARFFDYFETSQQNGLGGEALKPKTISMLLPSQEDISRPAQVDIPLSALAHHRQVSLDKVTVKVKARLESSNDRLMADMSAPVSNECSDPSASQEDVGEINLTFNVGDSSEGVARVVQNITKMI